MKPLPYLSLCGAIGFGVCLLALAVLEMGQKPEPSKAAQQTRVLSVMLCLLLASWSSIVSLVTAWCPVILGSDRRPLYWVVPLVVAWILFVQWFDWASLAPPHPAGTNPQHEVRSPKFE